MDSWSAKRENTEVLEDINRPWREKAPLASVRFSDPCFCFS